jgi:6-pyruvoyltetrahydropterin/6-carboxytetrahydropterin synthase
MALTIEKTFRFDAGHRALGFKNGKEETLHGHTWWLRLVVETRGALGPLKTIFDTNELARIVKPIIERFDHAFIVWSEDPLYERLAEICRIGNIEDKLIRVDFNPTIEGLAEHLFHLVKARLSLHDAALTRAELDAAATLRATYSE